MPHTTTGVIELAPFRTKPGVDEQQLLARIDGMAPALAAFPGFIGRDTVKMHDGSWIDIVRWRERAAIESAMQGVMHSPSCLAFFELLDDTGASMRHGLLMRSQIS
ncbi:antibiotic biosynthesis monooxygenase [Massilia sp. TS11]|uniref:antibiotic biosynthesis monooxygenase family protein n=1 Tax=Massilia sp. TS11 TaxID=2908003 RepID=UPI001EDA4A3E|nr:antibiotic biosynthesis monooxygenase [Massilia sp. TS11]MCG2585010.1 antibiotic biosynthesis monooxygenase [Massilia sp. TS11]